MSTQSIIEHRANYYYVEFREDFLHIAHACAYKKSTKEGQKSKASAHCKALILSILEGWTNHKRGKGGDLFISMSYAQWGEAMYGMFGRSAILDSLEELIGEGLISRETTRAYGKDTYKYLLNHAEVNLRLKALPDRDPHGTRPQVNASPSQSETRPQRDGLGDHPSQSKPDPSTNKPVTHPKGDATGPQVNEDPSKSGPFIESDLASSYHQNTETNDRPSSSAHSKNENHFDFSPDEQQLLAWITEQQYTPSITVATYPRIKEQVGKLLPYLKTPEDLKSLCAFCVPKIKGEDKTVYLGNMTRWVKAWTKGRSLLPPQEQAAPATMNQAQAEAFARTLLDTYPAELLGIDQTYPGDDRIWSFCLQCAPGEWLYFASPEHYYNPSVWERERIEQARQYGQSLVQNRKVS